jgi:allantoinase
MTVDLLVRARRAVIGGGETPASVSIHRGRIVRVGAIDDALAADEVVELDTDVVLLPGLVDSHVHVNEPGHTEWEGFASATRAAAAGGITTLADMPLDSVPTTVDTAALETKRAAATGQCFVDVGFWGGAVPGNLAELRALHTAGVLGFKCFLADSGSPDFPPLSAGELVDVMRVVRQLNSVLLIHAEAEAELATAAAARGRGYAGFLASRPPRVEDAAVAMVLEAARETGARAHIVHLSSAGALPLLAAARRDGLRVTAETCPHYLTLAAEDIPDGATEFACCPPIRDLGNQDLLWAGLADGTLDFVVSDHSPCAIGLKHRDTGDFGRVWGGISSLQLSLPVVWTEARRRGFALTDVVEWMSQRPARLAGLSAKGHIDVGRDADLCVFDPDAKFVVRAETLHHKQPITPYAGRTLRGAVRRTWLRGREIDLIRPTGRLVSTEYRRSAG